MKAQSPPVQPGDPVPFVDFQLSRVHVHQHVGMVAVQAAHAVVGVHRQKYVRVAQGVDAVGFVCVHDFCYKCIGTKITDCPDTVFAVKLNFLRCAAEEVCVDNADGHRLACMLRPETV